MYYNFTQEKRKKHVFHYYLSHCKSSDMGINMFQNAIHIVKICEWHFCFWSIIMIKNTS